MERKLTTKTLIILGMALSLGSLYSKPAPAQQDQKGRSERTYNQVPQSRADEFTKELSSGNSPACAQNQEKATGDCAPGQNSCGENRCCNSRQSCCLDSKGEHFCSDGRCPNVSGSNLGAQLVSDSMRRLIRSLQSGL
jgi:hypothetical protein